ncbi:hypothetical protein D3C85_1678100 [compost metagenome]
MAQGLAGCEPKALGAGEGHAAAGGNAGFEFEPTVGGVVLQFVGVGGVRPDLPIQPGLVLVDALDSGADAGGADEVVAVAADGSIGQLVADVAQDGVTDRVVARGGERH